MGAWGAFFEAGTSGLYTLPQRTAMNDQLYLKLLESHLLLLIKKARNVETIIWPPQSSDLNTINTLGLYEKKKKKLLRNSYVTSYVNMDFIFFRSIIGFEAKNNRLISWQNLC